MEFGIKKYDMPIRKSGKRQRKEGIELSNQQSWRKGKLQVFRNTGSRCEEVIKEKYEKHTADERENSWKANSVAEVSSKE